MERHMAKFTDDNDDVVYINTRLTAIVSMTYNPNDSDKLTTLILSIIDTLIIEELILKGDPDNIWKKFHMARKGEW